MDSQPEYLEALWNDLLTREPERIRKAFYSLDPPSQGFVLAHLQRMLSESDWQPEQRLSARAALQALEKLSDQEE
ncbi:MAG: hypothetical protein A2Y53_05345 [Chloroflexi bacterium RBG_16_47_49]|nr:MAG: hypothetical protein A2Y53_05345 [Chloroflexi bacterium RBG_16_47_49]